MLIPSSLALVGGGQTITKYYEGGRGDPIITY